MPPAQELTAPSPRVPALSVPRVAVRYRRRAGGPRAHRADLPRPVGADVRPVGLDRLGPRDPAPRPLDRRRPVVEAAAGPADHAVRALRRPRARPVALRRPRRRHRRRRHGLPASRGGSAESPAGAAAAGAYAVAPWMLRNSALGNSEGLLVALGLAAVDRHLAGRTRHAFLFGIGAALLRPEAWPFIGLYGLWLFWRDPGRAQARRGGLRLAAGAVAAARAVGLGRPAARRAPRAATRAPTARPSPTTRSARWCGSSATMLTPALWIGLGALVVMIALRLGSDRRERRAAVGLALRRRRVGRRGRGDDQRRLQRQRALPDHAGGASACVLGRDGHRLARPAPLPRALVRERASPSRRCPSRPPSRFAAPSVGRLDAVRASVYYQARLTDGLAGRHRAGRRRRSPAARAGTIYTGAFQVPLGRLVLRRAHDDVRSASSPATAAEAPAVVCGRTTTSQQPLRRCPSLESLGGEAAVQTLRASPAAGASSGRCRLSAHGATVARPRARIAGWAPLAWPSACPKSLLVLAFLIGLSLALRTQAIHAPLLDRRGALGRHLLAPAGRHPRRPAQGRLAAAVLPDPQAVDERLRQRRGRHARALGGLRDPDRPGRAGWAGGRSSASAPAWIAALLAALNPFLTYYAQETRMYALVALLSMVVTATLRRRLRPGPARVAARLRRRAGAARLHPQLGAVPRHRDGGGARRRSGTPAPTGAPCCATRCSPTGSPRCSTCRGCRSCSPRPGTPARRGRSGRRFQALLNGLANLLGGAGAGDGLRARRAASGSATILAGARALAAGARGAVGG